jgi:SAM-dependent methyltransferase
MPGLGTATTRPRDARPAERRQTPPVPQAAQSPPPDQGAASGADGAGRLWPRAFAALYDPLLSLSDRAGLGEERRACVSGARGRVLELGAGTGRNLRHYPPGLERLVLSEPEAPMARRLQRRLAAGELHGAAPAGATEVVAAKAEELPFGDGEFDTVVSTLVLCTVADQPRALAEIARVLSPGGALLFLEHVRADRLAAWQDRLHDPWLAFGNGCHCNRDTVEGLRSAGYDVRELRHGTLKRLGPLVRPLVRGVAVPAP